MRSLVPLPAEVEWMAGVAFELPAQTAGQLAEGVPFDGDGLATAVVDDEALGAEGYRLEVALGGVTLTAGAPAGLARGLQTLRQLVPLDPPYTVPGVRIADRPRYAWRGAMLDVSRHFFGVEAVLRFVDLIALHKLNVFHLHLSDDQGWRIAIDRWPGLTERGATTAVGGGPGGFYTKDDYARIVSHAAERHVTVVPEIDTPGHTHAALVAYPELSCDGAPREPYTGIDVGFSSLCAGKEITYRFLDDILGELAAITPGGYLHIGGDEALSTSREEYSKFVGRAQALVHTHGKQVIGWEELASTPVAPGTLVQYWNTGRDDPAELPRAAAAQGARLIMSPAGRVYLDMKYDHETPLGLEWAGHVELRDAYDWDPATLVDGVDPASIEGVETALWTETIETTEHMDQMVFPRLAAVAEVAWTAQDQRSWEDFRARVADQAARWEALGVRFHRTPQVDWPG